MSLHRKTRPRRRLLLAALLLMLAYGTCYQLWYHPALVEPGPFRHQRDLAGHSGGIWSDRFHPSAPLLLSGGVDSSICTWDRATGRLLQRWKTPSGITCLALSHNGLYAATAHYDAQVRLWSLPGGRLLRTYSGAPRTTWTLRFGGGDSSIAAGNEDGRIFLWDRESGQLLQTLVGHTRNVWDLAFSPAGDLLASGSFDSKVLIWNPHTGGLLRILKAHSEAVVSLAWSHDGSTLASASDDCTVKLWDTRDWILRRSIRTPEHQQGLDFSPDDSWLITSGRDKSAFGELLQNFLGDSHYNKGVSMRLWETGSGKLLQTFRHHANDVNDVQFSPDGHSLLAASDDGLLSLWGREP